MSSSNRTLHMTEGNPVSLLLKFAVPMLIGNLFQQVYNLVDSIIVGKMIGADALAAVGATNSVTFMFFALCNGIGNGGGIVVSQFFGSGEQDKVRKSIINTAYIMILLPVIVGTVAYIAAEPLLVFLKTPDEVLADSLSYMHVMCIGIVFVSMYNFISSMLRALGDSKTPLHFLIFSCILNTGLDVLFVNMGYGVKGAAIATIVSQLISGLGCIIFALKSNSYFKFGKDDTAFDKDVLWRVIRLGVPLSLQFAMIAISCMALQRVVNSFGAVAMAAFTATSRIENIIHQPYQTLGMSISTYTGQNYGAKEYKRVIEGYHKGLLMMVVFTVFMVPVMQIFGNGIMRIFVDEPDVIAMGAHGLRLTSIFYVALGVIYVVRGVSNGLGDALFALLNGIIEVIGRFTVPILLTGISAIGLWGIWWSAGIVWLLSGATAWIRYRLYSRRIGLYSQPKTEENASSMQL